ncbi:uncharacterized protein LOC129941692 [Eupeodes corollae]|uniref:uncharacterized protein LOC129941692 n=1 Tax=Eupeodes corollae TaxID=290404 RepID=UPI002490EE75|nr:uncharacterized protein LOC129941692 [Eupeodes corollae]
MEQTPAELLKGILNTAERHPNAKVSKLIKSFEDDKTPQNIALLLIELAEHAEFSADITISLKYYLDCFKELRQEPSFAEAGVVLFNSSKIYAKRVDHIHSEIERLILSLSNVENTAEKEQNASNLEAASQNTEKVKRGKKRTLEQINGAIEADMSSKRFKKLANNKRFEGATTPKRNNILKTLVPESDKSMKSYIPHSTWQYSAIQDFDYEDEIDSKKNYKLFTYHLEHRYNTLIPDINFKMYFKIKDFINGDCNDAALPESWPPLSEAYIEQFLDFEDAILQREGHLSKAREKLDASSRLKDHCGNSFDKGNVQNSDNAFTSADSGFETDLNTSSILTCSQTQGNMSTQISVCGSNTSAKSFDSGIGSEMSVQSQAMDESQTSVSESTQNIGDSLESGTGLDTSNPSQTTNESQNSLLGSSHLNGDVTETTDVFKMSISDSNRISGDSGLDCNESSQPTESKEQNVTDVSPQGINELEINTHKTNSDPTLLDPTMPRGDDDLSTLKIILPHLPDEGIYFSDLDEKDRQMLSPAVVTQDVFRCVKDKSNIVIRVDDAIEHLFKIKEPSEEILSLPLYERQHFTLRLNILKIPLKYFNKNRGFKLTPEFDLLKKERLKKYLKRSSVISSTSVKRCLRTTKNVDEIPEHISPPSSPSYEPDWLGFPEDTLMDKNRTLSRDSGISLHPTDRENIEDFGESPPPDLLSSTLKPGALEDGFNENVESSTTTPTEEIPKPSSTASPAEELPESSEKTSPEELPAPLEETSEVIKEPNNPTAVEKEVSTNDDKIESNGSTEDNQTDVDDMVMNEENRVRTKVHEWHSHLQPILACSRERHHFDVFAIGTEIMTQFDRNDVGTEKVSFKNVMEEKDESLISRYFLSMLLLANQGNIMIDVQNKSTNEPSELHDIRLKLLSRKRNIVSLEDNIGLRTPAATPTTNINQGGQQPLKAIVRTLKSVPEVPKIDDRDSGVALSEASIL